MVVLWPVPTGQKMKSCSMGVMAKLENPIGYC